MPVLHLGLVLAAAVAVFVAPVQAVAEASIVIKGHYTAKDQQAERYVNVPFMVPAGTTRVEVELLYDRAGGENVVDLGLLEPGDLGLGLGLGTKAFRGWTGGERSAIFVSDSDATPGYWPGPIQPGRWHVGLGLYKVGASGVSVEVRVRTSAAPAGQPLPLPGRPKEPIRPGPAWFSGALHAHTHHSDGALSAQGLAERARASGLDFLAVTDHNNTAHQREVINVAGLLTIVGEEVTTPGGHMNVWGLGGVRDFVDFRVLPGDGALTPLIDALVARGAVIGINHPYSACVACSWTHALPPGISTIEISGREPEETPRAVALWDTLLRQGRRVTAIGVSDWHRGDAPLGSASVRVWAPELSTRAILDSIREGRVVVMIDGTTPPPDLRVRAGKNEARIGGTLKVRRGDAYEVALAVAGAVYEGGRAELFWNGERVASARLADGRARFERFASTNGYLRVNVLAPSDTPLAVTNPVWIQAEGR